jgi:hypothetical protein
MPNRIVREGFLDSEAINSLEAFTECIFHRLLIVSDDAGRFDGRAQIVASRCFPLRDSIRAKDVEGHLLKLEQAGLLIRYEWNGKPFLQLTKWQKAGKSLTSKFPWSDGSFSIKYAKAETRDGVKEFVTTSLPHTHPIRTPSEWGSRESNTETETETDTETETGNPPSQNGSGEIPTLDEVKTAASMMGILESSAIGFWEWHEINNAWRKNGTLIKWRLKLVKWAWNDKEFKANAKRNGNSQTVDRNQGTANAGKANQYANLGRVVSNQSVR